MKAVTYKHYGSPENISVSALPEPATKPGHMLIKVHATTVNRTDLAALRGHPLISRLMLGIAKPRQIVLGTDFAGEVVACEANSGTFSIGDRVFGFSDMGFGSQAEMICIPANRNISHIPEQFSFEEATACIEGAHYAFNFINKVPLKTGDSVLVNGATGAIGSAMVQMLAYLGARVTATCRKDHFGLAKKLGAEQVIDYVSEDFTQCGKSFEYVFDAVGKSSFGACKGLLAPKGTYISSELGAWSQNIYYSLVTPFLGRKKVAFPFPTNIPATINFVKKLATENKFRPVLDQTFPIDKAKEAYEYVGHGQKIGNVILGIGQRDEDMQ